MLSLPPILEPIRARIEPAIAPSVGLAPAPAGSARPSSHFGGEPRLPLGTPWPRSDRGPLSFLGELDLRELASVGGVTLGLPRVGLLALFYDVEEQPWGNDPSHASSFAVVYTADEEDAFVTEAPEGVIPFNEEPLVAWRARSLPGTHDLAARALLAGCGDEELRAYADRVEALAITDAPSNILPVLRQQVGGHPQWRTHDGRVTAELASSRRAARDIGALGAADRARVESAASSWRLLWQLEPQDDRFTWASTGALYVLLRESDLATRRFDRAWVTFQAS